MELRDDDFLRLAKIIKAKYGLDLYEKKYLVESRLKNYVLDCGFDDFGEYFETVYVDRSGIEMTNIISRLTTNYTYFMRESEHFRHFTEQFLPQAERNKLNRELCIWSAGCSYGNEPYNLAMFLEEFFGARHKHWDSKILATDISFNALRMAKRGVFAEQALQELPAFWREKYFVRNPNGTYQVTEAVRNNVVFKYHNLMEPISFKKQFDLIVCRNVMIYFDDPTKKALIDRFYDATLPGGYLYIGHAENAPKGIKYETVQPAILRKPLKGDK
ncbi:chemotaxis protein methyltransferase CheR [Ruminococcaceae bacterium FB2012]|nr:chemotaxis protein methyltransferase CheR [Ruminococcaceae bacterium FB2012]